jgi:SAM-dependent methyltransferase
VIDGDVTTVSAREQYEIERKLARRLRSVSKEERRRVYAEVYDELFERAPRDRRASRPDDAALGSRRAAQLRLLGSLIGPQATLLEIGPGDCAVLNAIAPTVQRAYAVDVTSRRAEQTSFAPNVEFVVSDGVTVPVPTSTITFAYSNQVLEHMHPDDVRDHLADVHRVLAPGGRLLCITPNRVTGPHDISRHFTERASGLHLSEYSIGELCDLLALDLVLLACRDRCHIAVYHFFGSPSPAPRGSRT